MEDNVVELVTFNLKEGVTEQQFLAASDKFQASFLSLQKGYIVRELSKNENFWSDLVLWKTLDDAKNAMKDTEQLATTTPCPDFLNFLFYIDENSCDLKYLGFKKINSI